MFRDESLEEIVGGRFNWFSIKQKDICMAKRKQASEHGSPLIVRFPSDEYGAHSRRTLYFLFLKAQFITGRVFAG